MPSSEPRHKSCASFTIVMRRRSVVVTYIIGMAPTKAACAIHILSSGSGPWY